MPSRTGVTSATCADRRKPIVVAWVKFRLRYRIGVQSASAKRPFKRPAACSSVCRISEYASTSARLQRRDLQERHIPLTVRIGLHEVLERSEALGEAFAVVEPIHAYDQLSSHQTRDHALDLLLAHRLLGLRDDRIDIHTDGIGSHLRQAFAGLDARAERAHVVFRLEAHEIVVTEVADQLLVIRQQPKHLHVRKRRVQEKSDGPFEARAGAESAPSG